MGYYCRVATFTTSMALIIGSIVALGLCVIIVSKPNLHGAKYEEGVCQMTTTSVDIDIVPLISCNCGRGHKSVCTSYYPCITVSGTFYRDKDIIEKNKAGYNISGKESGIPGTFHYDYSAVNEDCFGAPDCMSDYISNKELVRKYWNETWLKVKDEDYFPCWGNDGHMYFTMKYSGAKAFAGIFLPVLGFIIGVGIGVYYWKKC